MKKSKKYVEASKKVEKNTLYTKEDAIKLVKETATTKFDSTVEVAIKLNLDTKKADQQLRGSLVLPNGTGKTKKVLVIAKGEAAQKAKDAGADYVGDMDMINKIQNENWFDFDVIVATPVSSPTVSFKIDIFFRTTATVTFDIAVASITASSPFTKSIIFLVFVLSS